ncbi:MAG TPA: hypothetical protein VH352_24600, partial [Pseudonocardiaceae bacterium]|nr:hypothetical protein [Pseudonocardiaceae bacterium]
MLLSQDVADRVEQADLDYLVVRVGAMAAVPGNPDGAEVRRVGRGCAFIVKAAPNPVLNHVTGLTASDVAALPELARWYREHGLTVRVEVTPSQADPVLFAA